MVLLVDDDEAVQHQIAHLSEEIDLTKAEPPGIETKIFPSLPANNNEDESIQ